MFEELKKAAGLSPDRIVQIRDFANDEPVIEAVGQASAIQPDAGNVGISVILEDAGLDKIRVTRAIRLVTGYDLAAAKTAAESAPCTILTCADDREAENAKRELEEAGATVSISGLRKEYSSSPIDGDDEYCDVMLEGYGDNKIAVIKVIRESTGLGLKEAKELVEASPTVAMRNVSRNRALDVVKALVNAGAAASVRTAEPIKPKPMVERFEFGQMEGTNQFIARLHVLTKEEGGRHTPFFEGYCPSFCCDAYEVTCMIHMPSDREMVIPGDTLNLPIDVPVTVSVVDGQRFSIKENGRLVANGVIDSPDNPNSSTVQGLEASSISSGLESLTKSITEQNLSASRITARIRVLSPDEGGRHTPFFDGYRPTFCCSVGEAACVVRVSANLDMVMPGDNVELSIELASSMHLVEGDNFELRENGKTMAYGTVIAL